MRIAASRRSSNELPRQAVPVVHPQHLRDGLIDPDGAPDADVATLEEYRSVRSITTSLSTATFEDFEIPLPPLAEQQRILSALRSLNEQTVIFERRLNASRAAQPGGRGQGHRVNSPCPLDRGAL